VLVTVGDHDQQKTADRAAGLVGTTLLCRALEASAGSEPLCGRHDLPAGLLDRQIQHPPLRLARGVGLAEVAATEAHALPVERRRGGDPGAAGGCLLLGACRPSA